MDQYSLLFFLFLVPTLGSPFPISVPSFNVCLMFYPEDGGTSLLRNVGTYLANYTASHLTISHLHVHLRENPQIKSFIQKCALLIVLEVTENIKSNIFRDMTPSNLVSVDWQFGGDYCQASSQEETGECCVCLSLRIWRWRHIPPKRRSSSRLHLRRHIFHSHRFEHLESSIIKII
jgi:hypothetical protein